MKVRNPTIVGTIRFPRAELRGWALIYPGRQKPCWSIFQVKSNAYEHARRLEGFRGLTPKQLRERGYRVARARLVVEGSDE